MLLFSIPFSIILSARFKTSDNDNYVFFVAGNENVLLCLIFQIVFNNWHSFTTMMMVLMSFTIGYNWKDDSYSVLEHINITLRSVIIVVFTGIFMYVEERHFRDLFRYKSNLEEKDSLHKEILNLIPESIVVMSDSLERQYFNDCFKCKFPEEESSSAKKNDFLTRFVELKKQDECVPNEGNDAGRVIPSLVIPTVKRNLRNIIEDYIESLKFAAPKPQTLVTLDSYVETSPGNMNNCQVYRGSFIKNPDAEGIAQEQNIEAVEIKLTSVIFDGKKSILTVIRQAPELQLLEQLERTSKYKDELLASVSHELRTPINSNINLINEALKSSEVPIHIKTELLDPAIKSGKLLLNLVNDILDISQIRERKLRLVSQIVDFRKLLQECHYLFEQQCKQKGLSLNLTIDKRIPAKIRTDPNRFTQIVLNLLSNAYKFTFEGTISIEATLASGGLIKISVSDTGTGIRREDMGKLMKKFEKIDSGDLATHNSTGAGLGLSIANSLAKMLGPKDPEKRGLKFESEWGVGTIASFLIRSRRSFEPDSEIINLNARASIEIKEAQITSIKFDMEEEENSSEYIEEELPKREEYKFFGDDSGRSMMNSIAKLIQYSEQKSSEICTKEFLLSSTKERGACRCPQVMIVDDDGFNVFTLETLLTSLRVSFESALSGIQCIKIIKSARKCCMGCRRFKVILLDGNMPIKNGVETLKELITWNKGLDSPWDMKVLGCTAYTSKEKSQEFLDAGAVEHLIKPLNKVDLERVLNKYLQ